MISLGKDDQSQVEQTLAKAVGSGVGRPFKCFIGSGTLLLSFMVMGPLMINIDLKSGNLEINLGRPTAIDVQNGWWPHAVESRGKDCRPNRELPLQVLHGCSHTGFQNFYK